MNDRAAGGVVTQLRFGIAPATVSKLLGVFDSAAGIDAVWIFGSRARGTEPRGALEIHRPRGTDDLEYLPKVARYRTDRRSRPGEQRAGQAAHPVASQP